MTELTAGKSVTNDGAAARRFVDAFALGWSEPEDADQLADHFDKWITEDYTFNQPPMRATYVGRSAFREDFARPLLGLLSNVRGTVETWAQTGDTVFINLRLDANLGLRPVVIEVVDRIQLVDGLGARRVTFINVDFARFALALLMAPRLWRPAVSWLLDDRRAARQSSWS